MEIGPISGIRPISMVKSPSPAPDLSGVFAVEFRGHQEEDSSLGSSRKAPRGLEEEAEEGDSMDEIVVASNDASISDGSDSLVPRQISIFA